MFGTAANALGAFMYKGCLRQVPLRVLFGTLISFGALVASSQLVLIWTVSGDSTPSGTCQTSGSPSETTSSSTW
eukprot:scaffold7924_cov70-Phaeocystis_antarctica.AAC.1